MGHAGHARQHDAKQQEDRHARNPRRDTMERVCVHGSLPEVGRRRVIRPYRIYPWGVKDPNVLALGLEHALPTDLPGRVEEEAERYPYAGDGPGGLPTRL